MLRVIVLTLAAVGSATAADVTVAQLKPASTVSGARVRLGNVAQLSGGDGACKARLDEIDLGPAPEPGRIVDLNRYDVTAGVEAMRPLSAECPLRWEGIAHTSIRVRGIPLDVQRMLSDAGDALKVELAKHYESVLVHPISMRQTQMPEVGTDTRIEYRLPDTRHVAPRLVVLAELKDADGHRRSVPLWFDVSAYRGVWVANRALGVNHAVSALDFRQETVDVTRLGAEPVALDASLDSMVIRRPVRLDEPLRDADIMRQMDVAVGSVVAVQARSGPVAVQTTGIALQASEIGDRLLVRLPRSQEVIAAKVLGRGVVEVIE